MMPGLPKIGNDFKHRDCRAAAPETGPARGRVKHAKDGILTVQNHPFCVRPASNWAKSSQIWQLVHLKRQPVHLERKPVDLFYEPVDLQTERVRFQTKLVRAWREPVHLKSEPAGFYAERASIADERAPPPGQPVGRPGARPRTPGGRTALGLRQPSGALGKAQPSCRLPRSGAGN